VPALRSIDDLSQYQIYDGTAVRKKNGRPAAYVTVEDSGYWVNFPTYTGTQVSGCLVASLTTTAVTGETAAARFLSLLDTSSNNDIRSTARAILIGRQDGSSPTSNWGTRRSSTWYATAASAGVDTWTRSSRSTPVLKPSSTGGTDRRSVRLRRWRSTSGASAWASQEEHVRQLSRCLHL